jgi:hypothetical protein
MAWFIASVIPISLMIFGLANPSAPACTDFYGFIGLPLALLLTIAFIGRTIRTKDMPASEKCVWIAALVLLFPFAIALPVYAYSRIVKSARTDLKPTTHP